MANQTQRWKLTYARGSGPKAMSDALNESYLMSVPVEALRELKAWVDTALGVE